MKGRGKIKGILIEGDDGHEYLLGFGPRINAGRRSSAAGKSMVRSSRSRIPSRRRNWR